MSSAKKITESDLDHVAHLARLNLTDAEKATFLPQLESVLEYLDKLNAVDTASIDPSFQITPLKNVFRPDVVTKSLTQTEALSSASKTKDSYFVVPATITKK